MPIIRYRLGAAYVAPHVRYEPTTGFAGSHDPASVRELPAFTPKPTLPSLRDVLGCDPFSFNVADDDLAKLPAPVAMRGTTVTICEPRKARGYRGQR